MFKSKVLLHYKRKDVQDELVFASKNREVAVSFNMKGYGKRPDVLNYPADVMEFVKNGATSFHASEELWNNPLNIDSKLSRKELDELRIGWDLVLDIDCKVWEYSAIAADLLIKALKYHGIESISCKFSGNHGFHIGVPFKAFPEKVNNKDTKLLFPEAARIIAEYLQNMIKKHLSEKLLQYEDINIIAKRVEKTYTEIVKNNEFLPFEVLDIDTILISSRHLYRMPYSINEKSGLISVPINPDNVLSFDINTAKVENVKISEFRFLDDRNTKENEARQLIIQAYDYSMRKKDEIKIEINNNQNAQFEELQQAIPEDLFPPCIKKIFEGTIDGKKRMLFVLINFLSSCGWSYNDIEKRLNDWNKINKEQLREVYLLGQVRYAKQNNKKVLPPNCDNNMYYKDLGICCPDNICKKIKNPVNYSKRRAWYLQRQAENEGNENKTKKEKNKETENIKKEDNKELENIKNGQISDEKDNISTD